MDRQKHYQFTGKYNDIILKNLWHLQSEKRQKIIVRTPFIPSITDTQANLTAIKTHLKNLRIDGYELLPHNASAKKKKPEELTHLA